MADPPDSIRAFCKEVQSTRLEELTQSPNYIDPLPSERLTKHDRLLPDYKASAKQQDDYPRIQLVFYDFSGRCSMPNCPQAGRHMHSIQARAPMQVKEFPGLHLYPGVFVPAMPELLDAVMEIDQKGETDSRNVERLVQGTFAHVLDSCDEYQVRSLAMSISTAEHSITLRQPDLGTHGLVYLSLGCDVLLVLGKEAFMADKDNDESANEGVALNDNDWQGLVDFDPGEEGIDEAVQDSAPVEQRIRTSTKKAATPPPQPGLAAIHLRAGDAIVFDEQASTIWYGIAKVADGSSRLERYQWPHLREDEQDDGQTTTKGQLSGKAVQLEFR